MTGDVERVAVWKGAGAYTADIETDPPTKDIIGPLANAIAETKAAPAWRYVVGDVAQ
jgi:hypothetical protein